MIYNPPVTPLLRPGRRRPAACQRSRMLVHQGARALEIWSGSTVPVPAMRRAAEQALGLAKP
jgi:shikimate dehydrogenase